MKKVALHSFGCRTNQEEMTAFAASFKDEGYQVTTDLAEADIIVINSCSVTGAAETKNRRFIQALSGKYPQAEICVTGCLAQQKPEELALMPQVRWVVGNGMKGSVPQLVAQDSYGVHTSTVTAQSDIPMPSVIDTPENSSMTRFSLKVQEGCNHFCSFCIVPSLRGPSRSVSFDEVIATAREAIRLGYREIVLTGTHIGQYRDEGATFVAIIKAILTLDETIRLRMSSMNPADLTDELFELMRHNERLCRHIHVSAQSLSPTMLHAMKRSRRAMATLKDRLANLKRDLPTLHVGGDFIVGFPGEDEELFQETLKGIADWGFTYGHVFKYSPRPGTPAATLDGEVAESEKTRRADLLREALLVQQKEFYASLVGTTERIIIEKEHELKGITGNYIKVVGPQSDDFRRNRMVAVTFCSYDANLHQLQVEACR